MKSLLLRFCERLRREGFEVHVACAPAPGGRRLPEWLPLHGIPFTRRLLTLQHLVPLVKLYRLIRRERFDIVHVHTPIASIIGRIAAKVAGTRLVVYTAHGFPFHERMSRLGYRVAVFVERFFCRRMADLVFVQSQEDLEAAKRERITARAGRPPRWIGNGVDLSRFHPGREPLVREEFNIDPSAPLIAFVGRLSREKGILELLDAVDRVRRQVPNLRVLMVGSQNTERGGESFLELTDQRIEALDLRDVVTLAGLRSDVERLLREASVFVLPSHREGMPRSILEAMATGLPVVATDIRGCREEVVDGVTGRLVPVDDAAALAEAILGMLEDAGAAHAMGAAGRRRAEALFAEDRVFDRQAEALRELLGDPRG